MQRDPSWKPFLTDEFKAADHARGERIKQLKEKIKELTAERRRAYYAARMKAKRARAKAAKAKRKRNGNGNNGR